MDHAIVCVASYGRHNRLVNFLRMLADCELHFPMLSVIVLNTGDVPLPLFEYCGERVKLLHIVPINVTPAPRQYAAVMYEKVRAVAPFATDDMIFINADPDYHYNPHIFRLMREIFVERPEIDYLSFLNAGGVCPDTIINRLQFARARSCMGGSMIVRWKNFYPVVGEFFKQYEVTETISGDAGQFDNLFWDFLSEKTGSENNVYTLVDNFSLVQHCNVISEYLGTKGDKGVDSHMYAVNYDPRIDPFEIRKHREVRDGS